MKRLEKIVIVIIVSLLVSSVAIVCFKNFSKRYDHSVKPHITSRAIPFEANVKSNNILLDSYGESYKFARNAWDMQNCYGKVFISSGDYDKNSGATKIICYDCKTDEFVKLDSVGSEQLSRFFLFDKYLYTTAIDPVNWGVGEFYRISVESEAGEQFEKYQALPSNIHCFDMDSFDDKLFFSGSVASYANYSMIQYIEKKDMPVKDISKTKQIYLYKNGERIPNEKCYRVYELIVFKENLYAWHRGVEYDDEYSGLYVYNKNANRFDFIEGEKSLKYITSRKDSNIDFNYIQAEYKYGSKLILVNNGLYYTDDLLNYTECSFGEDYEGFIAKDVIEVSEQIYVLASKQLTDGSYETAVFVTEDLKTFSKVLYFNASSYMTSFAICNDTIIFGEGGTRQNTADSCGKLYTFKLD